MPASSTDNKSNKCRLENLYILLITRLIQQIKFVLIDFNFIILLK